MVNNYLIFNILYHFYLGANSIIKRQYFKKILALFKNFPFILLYYKGITKKKE